MEVNTEKIPEATVIPENSADDLLSRLAANTEEKKPTQNTNVKQWNFDVNETPAPTQTPEVKAENFDTPPAQPTTPGANEPTSEPKISKDLKMASARITVSALDSTQRVIFTPLINRKYAKKFNDDEVKRLDETNVIDADKNTLKEEDLTLRNKFDRLMKKRDKKIKDIPFTDVESQDLEKIFYQYMDAKNKTLPPEIMLLIGISNVIGKRAIDLFTE